MLLNQIFETKIVEGLNRTGRSDTAVIGWGRGMGHLGHMYLASSVITQANESQADPYFVVSRTVGKDDPLTPAEKLSIYKRVFAEHKQIFQSTSDAAPDLNRILGKLQEHGYKKVVVVLGEDQVQSFQYLKSYNGKTTKKGEVLYTFESIDVISRQQTNDPSKTLAGPRATDMRAVLLDPAKLDEDKFAVWREAMSPKLNDSEVHMIMKLAEHRLKNLNESTYHGDMMRQVYDKYRQPAPASVIQAIVNFLTVRLRSFAGYKEDFGEDYNEVKRSLHLIRSKKSSANWFELADAMFGYDTEFRELMVEFAEEELDPDLFNTLYNDVRNAQDQITGADIGNYKIDIGNLNKESVAEEAQDNGPYEYVVHYNDPKTRTSGTRTVKTTQPAPKSDSPDAKKFFGKWTGHYSAHEKRSDTANRAHDVVSQGEKKNEAMMPPSNFAGTEKGYKLGSKGQLKGKTKRPAKAGDLVGETKVVPVEESIELQMASLINLLEGKR